MISIAILLLKPVTQLLRDHGRRAALERARPCFERAISFHKTNRRPGSKIPELDNLKQERLALFTRPDDASAILREYEEIAVTHVIGMVNFGGVAMAEVRRTMELMSAKVFPSSSKRLLVIRTGSVSKNSSLTGK